jgi:hypothetical protein
MMYARRFAAGFVGGACLGAVMAGAAELADHFSGWLAYGMLWALIR